MGKFLIVVILFAAAVYSLLWLRERRRAARSGWTSPKRGSAPQTRQVAPDDDEDFLRWLNRKQRSGQTPEHPPEAPPAPPQAKDPKPAKDPKDDADKDRDSSTD